MDVLFVVDSRDAASVVRRAFGDGTPRITIESEYRSLTEPNSKTIERALCRERNYNIHYSLIISMDRALGRGYLVNVDNYPTVKRSRWSREQKLESINRRFDFFEETLNSKTVLISQWPEIIPTTICNSLGIRHYHLVEARYGSRMMWSDGDRLRGTNLERLLKANLKKVKSATAILNIPIQSSDYAITASGKTVLEKSIQLTTRRSTFIQMISWIFRSILLASLGRGKPNSYKFLAWLPVIWNRRRHFLYLKNLGLEPTDLEDVTVAYFPLHMEPEISLQQMGHEFNNVNEVITWVSKSIPADTILVVKEQPKILGHRSEMFYRNISMLGNVVFSEPNVDSWTWIGKARFVISIVGSVGEEAVHLGKPVVSLGREQVINQLPTVFVATTFENIRESIDQIYSGMVSQLSLEKSKRAFGDAIFRSSFPFEEYKDSYRSVDFDKNCILVVNELKKAFPDSLKSWTIQNK
jgi:hypothetical protein